MSSTPETTGLPRTAFRLLARLDHVSNRIYGARYNPLYHSGAIAVILLGLLIITGLYLLLFYRIGAPYPSIARMTANPIGLWLRGLHRFASDAVLVAAAVHAFRMYAQRRTWGPRALAWVSGCLLVGLILVCGWTGYVLVWDAQALVLVKEGARFLDVLPIFSEPIGRAFVGESMPPSGFFFLNLFVHIALPLSLALLLWLHVARVARPVLFPHRTVTVVVTAALLALAILWPIALADEANPLVTPVRVPLDWFYAFWLPITDGLPVWVAFAFGSVLAAVALAVPWLTRPRVHGLPAPATVNERICTGCEQCVKDCPYDAIEMVPRADGRAGQIARVKTELCTACGICLGSCPPMAIGPMGTTARDQLADVRRFLTAQTPTRTDVVIIGCTWSAAATEAQRTGAKFLPVPCVGTVHSSVVELLLRGGAGGVLVVGCPEHDGRTREGVTWAQERLFEGRPADLKERVDRRRVRLAQAALTETTRYHDAARAFADDIAALAATGPEEELDILALCRAKNPEGVSV
jgi:quinol-cytochrome oxidoreductase complex cytochrome b subunit/coenzyme F420-reducing hydrogenase delta subunit/Pyruvate/2-oxoacid:ferredoxin oxidoreductase delta subunit